MRNNLTIEFLKGCSTTNFDAKCFILPSWMEARNGNTGVASTRGRAAWMN